jgi:hypothetical protein
MFATSTLMLSSAVALIAGLAALPARADEPVDCDPACGAGQTCVQGVCMIPAPAPAADRSPSPTPPAQPPVAYPPPQTPYPPYGYQPPSYLPAPAPPRPPRTGFLALPYAGIHSFSGQGNGDLDPGFRVGSLVGARVSDLFSANMEVTFDILNPNNPAGVSASAYMLHATASPLFHIAAPPAEIVIGPKLGAWFEWGTASEGTIHADVTERGWTLGVNVGLFFPVGDGAAQLGMLASFANLQITHACATLTGYGYDQRVCEDGSDVDVFGLTFAALF